MNEDYIYGTPDAIDEEDLKMMQATEDAIKAPPPPAEEVEQQTTEQSTEASKPEPTEEDKKKVEEDKNDGYYGERDPNEQQPGQEGADFGDSARTYAEMAATLPTALLDFGVDVVNLIPGVDFKKLPKFQNDTLQAIRDIESVVLPTIGAVALGQPQAAKLANVGSLSKLAYLKDPLAKWIGTTLYGAGAGATVDAISEQSENDNVSRIAKDAFPRAFGWIPDSWTTLDTDSPDQKRLKNVTEGIGLGLFTDVLGGLAKITAASIESAKATRWIPETEKAKNWFTKNAPVKVESVEDAVNSSAAKRSEALDEAGAYGFTKNTDLDKPIRGVHDMYGYDEVGIRSTDDYGIVGASVDQARIANNLDTSYGRLGSAMSDSALKYSLEGVEEYTDVMKGLRDALSEADQYGYKLKSGKVINSVTIRESAEQLARDMGYMTKGELEAQLNKFKTGIDADTGLPSMSSEGMAAVKIAIKNAMMDFADPASQALLRTSMAGQVADMAMGARLVEGTPGAIRSQEQILDRLEMLMVANGEVGKQRGFALNMMNVFKRGGKKLSPAELKKKGADTLDQLMAESKEVVDTMRGISEQRPDYLAPFIMAYEASDGNVRSMDALNNYLRNSLAVWSKAFYDGSPEVPSLVMKGFWANLYNSTLSALATPIKAFVANTTLLVQRPVALAIGGMTNSKIRRRGMFMYSSLHETVGKGMKYFAETMRRSAVDPNYAGVVGREGLVTTNKKQVETLKVYADVAAKQGNFGPQVMMEQIEAINDLAEHPWLRLGNRLMQATDGMTQAIIANIEARGKAFDLLDAGRIDEDMMQQVAEQSYRQMWAKDEMGREVLNDKAIKHAAGEIAMNLDNAASQGLSEVIISVPAVKPFLLFTKTPINMMSFAASHNPLGLFIKDYGKFSRPFGEMPVNRVRELLESRGIPFDESAEIQYEMIRAEMKGRKAIGTLAVSAAAGLFLSDRLTGNGIYDRQKQKLRRDADWKPRSIRLPGGNWVSYDNLGAISDYIALTADIMDNFDVLREDGVGEMLHAMGFVLAASVTDKSMLAGIEPIYDISQGNVAAINRWASSFLPAAVMPGASAQAELGRLIAPNLKVVEENLAAMIANRTVAKGMLPDQYDWIDGDKVNLPDNIWARLWNTYSPWKVNGKISPEKQFLMDIEYDGRPSMKTDGRGVDLTIDEQAEVYRIMGRDKIFRQAIKRIMNTTTGKEFRALYKRMEDPSLEDLQLIHGELDIALNIAKEAAIEEIDAMNGGQIQQRREDEAQRKQDSREADVDNILQYAR